MELVPAAIPNAARGRKGFRPAAADGYAISGARIQGECEPGGLRLRHELDETTHAELDDVGVLVVVISNDASRSRKGKCPTSAIECPPRRHEANRPPVQQVPQTYWFWGHLSADDPHVGWEAVLLR
jgi:hypothetical protein